MGEDDGYNELEMRYDRARQRGEISDREFIDFQHNRGEAEADSKIMEFEAHQHDRELMSPPACNKQANILGEYTQRNPKNEAFKKEIVKVIEDYNKENKTQTLPQLTKTLVATHSNFCDDCKALKGKVELGKCQLTHGKLTLSDWDDKFDGVAYVGKFTSYGDNNKKDELKKIVDHFSKKYGLHAEDKWVEDAQNKNTGEYVFWAVLKPKDTK